MLGTAGTPRRGQAPAAHAPWSLPVLVVSLCLLTAFCAVTSWTAHVVPAEDGAVREDVMVEDLLTKHVDVMVDMCQNSAVTVTNKYTAKNGAVAADVPIFQHLHVLEPFREHTFSVVSPNTDDYDYYFLFDGEVVKGSTVTYTPETTSDVMVLMVTLGKSPAPHSSTCVVRTTTRYVRREIRALDDEDRETFLNTFRQLYDTEDQEGQDTYGPGYRSMRSLAETHLTWAGAKDCDHLHDGQSFFATHLLMTNELEESLQSVEPSIALPYWDYIQDVQKLVDEQDGDYVLYFRDNELFSDKYFGSSDPVTGEMLDSVFADVQVFEHDGTEDSVVPHNMYGLLRAPWSMAKSPKILRFFGYSGYVDNPGPQCADVDVIMAGDDLVALLSTMAGPPHGPIHLNMGGTSDGGDMADALSAAGASDDMVADLIELVAMTHKKFWREGGFYQCPDCDDDDEDCSCSCDPVVYTDTSYPQTLVDFAHLTDKYTFTDEILNTFMSQYCSTQMIEGDQLGAGGAIDPLFWLIHPTTERFFQLKVLSGTIASTKWANYLTGAAAYSGGTDGTIEAEECFGHQPDDRWDALPWMGRTFTIREFITFINPLEDNTPYVYENVDTMNCEEHLGYALTVDGVAKQYPAEGRTSGEGDPNDGSKGDLVD